MDRTIVIGDVHGCYFELVALLDEIGARQDDRLVFVGDLITKGPANREVVEFFQHRRNCESVLGNHEYLLLQHYRGRTVELEPTHRQAIADLGTNFGDFMELVSKFPLYMDLGEFLIVHAGIRLGQPIDKQRVEDLTQLRTLNGEGSEAGTPWFERYRGKKIVIFGHWVFDAPVVRKNAVGIDTGCVTAVASRQLSFLIAVWLASRRSSLTLTRKDATHVFRNENVWQASFPWPPIHRRRD
jgi:diadenosine tetraphosphatase ApaH/serine/threonine PP2A family protein phosphatase